MIFRDAPSLNMAGTKLEIGNKILDMVKEKGNTLAHAPPVTYQDTLEIAARLIQSLETFFPRPENKKKPSPISIAGKKIIITAGSTREHIDPIRILTRQSKTELPLAIARIAADNHAKVILIRGPDINVSLPNITHLKVNTAREMAELVKEHFTDADMFFSLAQVPSL